MGRMGYIQCLLPFACLFVQDTVVIQTITKAAMAGFIKGRDFVDVVSSRRLSDGTRILSGRRRATCQFDCFVSKSTFMSS